MKYTDIKINPDGSFTGKEDIGIGDPVNFSANFSLFLIREAWDNGVDFENEADGYGPGLGTNGDWSGIRDSSDEAIERMFEKSLNHFFSTRR